MKRIDWNRMWRERENFAAGNDKSEFWDRKAAAFKKKTDEKDLYAETFYQYMDICEGETVFDMGCGSGTLAVPFAQKGHEVWACDFSSEMLHFLMKDAEEAGVSDLIHPVKLDWNEDWEKRDLPKCDFAIASRSLIFKDLTASLKKLESVALKRCCLGAWDGPFTGYDRYVARAIGFERPGYGCHYIVMNELMDRDVYPEMRYIFTPFRKDRFESYEAGWKKLHDSFDGDLTDEQEILFDEYCREHLLEYENENGKYFQMDHGTMSSIAFISWDVRSLFDE